MLVALGLCAVALAPAAAAASGFDAVFRVDVERSVIDVSIRVDVDPGAHRRTFEVPADVEDVAALAGETPIPAQVVDADDFVALVAVDIPAGNAEIELRYAIPSGPPRTRGHARVNPAHVSFIAWLDGNLGSGSVRIELPPGFRGASYGGDIPIESDGPQGQVWMDDNLASSSLWMEFIARNEAGLARSSVPVGDQEVKIAGWADDPEWIAFAEETVAWAVPLLEELIGQPWPEPDLVVIESTEPNAIGAAGWFSVWDSEIAVDDQLDVRTMVHELAHAWFNYVRLEERWLVEGWAEDYSALAISLHTGEEVVPAVPDSSQPGTTQLDAWLRSGTGEGELNAYETSWYVLHTIREEVGTEAMAEVFATLLGGRRSYHVPGDPVVWPANTTARFLDVVENVGGSDVADDLLGSHILGAAWADRLELRASARAGYERLVASGYTVPPLIRDQLEGWKFELALPTIAAAESILERMGALESLAQEAGRPLPASIVDGYETAQSDLSAVEREVTRAEEAFGPDLDLDPGERSVAIGEFVNGVEPPAASGRGETSGWPWPALAGAVGLGVVVIGFGIGQARAARRF